MAALDGKFVVVMDHLADRYGPAVLPVSLVRDSRSGIDDLGQYDGGPPTLVPLEDFRTDLRGEARLVDVRTGETLSAKIYRLTSADA